MRYIFPHGIGNPPGLKCRQFASTTPYVAGPVSLDPLGEKPSHLHIACARHVLPKRTPSKILDPPLTVHGQKQRQGTFELPFRETSFRESDFPGNERKPNQPTYRSVELHTGLAHHL